MQCYAPFSELHPHLLGTPCLGVILFYLFSPVHPFTSWEKGVKKKERERERLVARAGRKVNSRSTGEVPGTGP